MIEVGFELHPDCNPGAPWCFLVPGEQVPSVSAATAGGLTLQEFSISEAFGYREFQEFSISEAFGYREFRVGGFAYREFLEGPER